MPEPVPDFFRSSNVAASGPLTREDMERGIEAISAKPLLPRAPLLLHPQKLAAGREAAVGACEAAWHCWRLADEMPWWAWIRRRGLIMAGIERAKFAEMMWATLGEGEERI